MVEKRLAFVSVLSLALFAAPSLFVSTSFAATSNAPNFVTPFNLSRDLGKASDPDVQNVGSNVSVAWTEGSNGIFFRASTNGGITWTPVISKPALKISLPGGTTQYPMMSINGTNVYVVFSQTVNNVLQLFEATSTDRGVIFGKPVQLTSGTPAGGFITPVIASWGNFVYVAYINASSDLSYVTCSGSAGASGSWTNPFQFGSFHEPQLAAYYGKYVYAVSDHSLQVSTDNCGIGAKAGDMNWTDDTPIMGIHAEPWITASGPNVYTLWETKGSTSRVQIMNSNNNGSSWTLPKNLSTTLPDAWNPMIGSYGNKSWAAFQQFPGGSGSQIFAYTTTKAGANWSNPVSLSGKGSSTSQTSFPFSIVSSDGLNVFVAWSQQIKTGYWVFRVGYSANGGTTWTSAPGINASRNTVGQAGDNNDVATGSIAAFGTHCYAAWQYMNGASNQIYFAYS